MTRKIEFAQAALAAPPDTREEARKLLQELSEGLAAVPPGSVFWDSMRASRLCLVVSGWSFFYTLDEDGLLVDAARR